MSSDGSERPEDELSTARQRLVEAAIKYALATYPNSHPVDTEFRRAVGALTALTATGDDRGSAEIGEASP